MSERKQAHIGYEYKDIRISAEYISFYLDSYKNFGWRTDESMPQRRSIGQVTVSLKRSRHIINKVELTRLQQNFEACVQEIKALEGRKGFGASAAALIVGLMGMAFVVGAVFAVTAQSPNYPLCAKLAVLGFTGCIVAPFLYRWMVERKTQWLAPLIEEKREEIYAICEKGYSLLPKDE